MQTLLTSDAIPDITSPANASRWQKFSHASSEGTAGTHDAIIYLENLGLPILKSSAFDPTKFVVANGQIYRKAFSAMVKVFDKIAFKIPIIFVNSVLYVSMAS